MTEKGVSKEENDELLDENNEEPQETAQNDSKPKKKYSLYRLLFTDKTAYFAILPSMVVGASNIFIYFILSKIINELTHFQQTKSLHNADNSIDIYDPMPKVTDLILWMLFLTILLSFSRFFDIFLWLRIGSFMSTKVRKDVFHKMMQSEVTLYDKETIGSILKLLTEDAQVVQDSFGVTKGSQIANLTQFITAIIVSFTYEWRLALIICVALPLVLVSTKVFFIFIGSLTMKSFAFNSQTMTIADEVLGSMRTVHSFNAEEHEIERYDNVSLQSIKAEQKSGLLIIVMLIVNCAILWGSIIGILYYGATIIQDNINNGVTNGLNIGELMSIYGIIMVGYMGIMMFQGSVSQETRAFFSGSRINDILDYESSIPFEGGHSFVLSDGNGEDQFKGKIEFKNVYFKYSTRDQYVLKNVSFTLNPKECIALVGQSGSGKSTCVQLIERFYDVTGGTILIDDIDIKEYDPRYLHRKIGLVSQEPCLFSTTVKNNIKYGSPSATDEEIIAAAEIANAKHFIDKFEQKFNTYVGEKGSTISGGQRQRIAIARAVLKNPSILITDEATSALDAQNENKVQIALDRVMEGRTSLIVAHRLSTIRKANKIFVFESWEIVESGSHEELLEKKGAYYNLVSKQLTTTQTA